MQNEELSQRKNLQVLSETNDKAGIKQNEPQINVTRFYTVHDKLLLPVVRENTFQQSRGSC